MNLQMTYNEQKKTA